MLSKKLQKAIERAEANLSPVNADRDHYVVGAFDYGDDTLSLMTTTSKSVAEQQVGHLKKMDEAHSVVVERSGVGMKVWIRTESDTWISRTYSGTGERTAAIRTGFDIDKIAARVSDSFTRRGRRVAKSIWSFEFPTEEALKEYLKEHPKADKSLHYVKEGEQKAPAKAEEGHGEVSQSGEKFAFTYKGIDGEQHKVVPKHHVRWTKEKVHKLIGEGNYSIISAGRNSYSDEEKGMDADNETFRNRHKQLQADLEEMGLPYMEVVGHYGGKEDSFLVVHGNHELPDGMKKGRKSFMVDHGEKDVDKTMTSLDELGSKYNQDSVLHGRKGENQMHFTTGKHKGKKCGGKGWNEAQSAEDYFTEANVGTNEHTKFQMDINECLKGGWFDR